MCTLSDTSGTDLSVKYVFLVEMMKSLMFTLCVQPAHVISEAAAVCCVCVGGCVWVCYVEVCEVVCVCVCGARHLCVSSGVCCVCVCVCVCVLRGGGIGMGRRLGFF